MSIYSNIFHYYRGQTKNSKDEVKELQIENNATKALINLFEHSDIELLDEFLKSQQIYVKSLSKAEFLYQVPNDLFRYSEVGLVIGIAESKEIRSGIEKSYNIPDAAIITDEITILIETKIGKKSFLTDEQLLGHERKLINKNIPMLEKKIVTWEEIRMTIQHSLPKLEGSLVTKFLIKHFEEFCKINCLGELKTSDYYFLKFEKLQARELAIQVHHFIWENPLFKDILDAETSDGIGYSKRIDSKRELKFATLTTARQRCLILHIGEKKDKLGLKYQEIIDQRLAIKFDRKDYEYEKYPHETYIRLEWVKDISQIMDLIEIAYRVR